MTNPINILTRFLRYIRDESLNLLLMLSGFFPERVLEKSDNKSIRTHNSNENKSGHSFKSNVAKTFYEKDATINATVTPTNFEEQDLFSTETLSLQYIKENLNNDIDEMLLRHNINNLFDKLSDEK
ncbi:hypothetical protein EDEG_02862 [Edhazardia aedis USNM 41457]|uniref:Uncharacterized protein n=1 Tax=Edhazardia aedis (strain USNM 41457) TaxID=1003232 RepID=J9D4L0_EDHAE|nr:hypothetical protein EDEG_02862 [Edhazardia aedis USNM 41457]|eukprot:EJW02741.1 hypothetical protein EDEG_02862 [Edhazardia aedis USNM 41457]